MTFSNYDAQVSPICKRLNFLKAQDIYKLELAKLMQKFHDGFLPSIYNGLFQRSSDLHNYNKDMLAIKTISFPVSIEILAKS